ncbi:MAG TPA: CoA-transferase [Candidatus Galloscillospira stercoripullorum]|nr:CoA-transferase [Candidatus Galloscillospira stercoripullorum]
MSQNDISRTADLMVTAIARELRAGESVFHGLASTVPHVAIQMADRCYGKNLNYVNITGGYKMHPDKLQVSTDGDNLFNGTKCSFNLTDIFDLAARGRLDTAFLGGVQIDQTAHLNNTCIGPYEQPKVKLPGGAGSAVLVPNAHRALVWRTKHDKRTFVEHVDFITSFGNVDKVFTPLCVFEKRQGKLELYLLYPGVTYEEVAENTAFPIGNDYKVMEDLTEAERACLAEIDPERVRDTEF